jgi:hypothetical protein
MSLCVIDGDLISYKASAASETRTIQSIDKVTNQVQEWQNRTVFKTFLAGQDSQSYEDFDVVDLQTEEPIENCLHTVKKMIAGIYEASGCDELKVVVQGEGNFRDNLLLPTKYKSNRAETIRPVHLKEARNYLLGKYKAELANTRESDDVLSSYAYEGHKTGKRIVQCTVDKDARQCEGWLFDWDKMQQPEYIKGIGEVYLDSKGKLRGKGRKWLYAQATMGDPSDCYKPTELTKAMYGEKAVYKDFAELTTDKECWQKMAELYQKWYPSEFEYAAWNGEVVQASWVQLLQVYVDCAHMQRWEGDRIIVKTVLDKMEISY